MARAAVNVDLSEISLTDFADHLNAACEVGSFLDLIDTVDLREALERRGENAPEDDISDEVVDVLKTMRVAFRDGDMARFIDLGEQLYRDALGVAV